MTDEVVAPDPAVIEQNTSGVVGVLAEALRGHWATGTPRWSDSLNRYVQLCNGCGVVDEHAEHQASVVAALPNIAIAVGDPFDATPEQMRFAAAVVAGSFETGDWDRPRTARKLLDIATARAEGNTNG